MKYRLFLLVSLVMVSACDTTTARYSTDYARQISTGKMLILPVNAEAYTVSSSGEERMIDYENHVEPKVARQLQRALQEHGYKNRILKKSELMENETYHDYSAFTQAFETSYEDAYKNGELMARDEAKNSVVHFGGRAKALSKKLGADTLVYVDYNETVSSSDAQAVDFLAGMAMQMLVGTNTSTPPDKARTIVAVIDGPSDSLLWMNYGGSAGGGLVDGMINSSEEQSDNHIKYTIHNALRELPKRDELFEEE